MNKKLIGLLLVLALVIGLLPVVALAEGEVLTAQMRILGYTDIKASTDGKCSYLVNKAVELTDSAGNTFNGSTLERIYAAAGSKEVPAEWNMKFEYPAGGTPTLTLKGVNVDYFNEIYADANGVSNAYSNKAETYHYFINTWGSTKYDLNIVIAEDSYVATGHYVVQPSTAAYQNVTISSVGDAKLTTRSGKGIVLGSGNDLTLNNANLDMETYKYNGGDTPALLTKGDGNITINGGKINIHCSFPVEKSGLGGSWYTPVASAIQASGTGNITLNNADVKLATNYHTVTSAGSIQTKGENAVVTINGGKLDITQGQAFGIYTPNGGKTVVTGGDISIKSGYYSVNTALKMTGGNWFSTGAGGTGSGNLYSDPDLTGFCGTIKTGTASDGDAVTEQTEYKAAKYLSITQHVPTEVTAKPADCKTDGNIQYWTCAKCGKYYSDAAGATEITDKESVKISKDTVQCKPEADDGDCTTAIKCSVCGKETTPANAAHTAGTWTDGKTNCTVCNKEFACTHTGGTATCEKKAVCTTCGEEYGELAAHTPAEDDGDCTTAVKCTVCGEDARPAGTHTGGTATCKAKAKCTNCGQEYGELAAHTPAEDDGDCSTAIKCTVCGAETTAAKTHVEEKIPGKPATTTETGLTEGKKCSTCGKILVAQKEIAKLPASGTNGNPATGDSHIAVWMGLMAVSAAAFVSIVVLGKKKIA